MWHPIYVQRWITSASISNVDSQPKVIAENYFLSVLLRYRNYRTSFPRDLATDILANRVA